MSRVFTFDEFRKQRATLQVPKESVVDLLNKALVACQSAERRARNGLTEEQRARVRAIQSDCFAMAAQGLHDETRIRSMLQQLESFGIPILWPQVQERPNDGPSLQEAYLEYLEAEKHYEKELRSIERHLKHDFK